MGPAMHRDTTEAATVGIVDRVARWWHETRDHWQKLRELRDLAPEDLQRMAHETGMSESEFARMAKQADGLPELLARRLASLNMNPADIEKLSPVLLGDLARTCCGCGDKKQCKADFAVGDPEEAWKGYCPNAGTLTSLRP
jgi:hypothetical protein